MKPRITKTAGGMWLCGIRFVDGWSRRPVLDMFAYVANTPRAAYEGWARQGQPA